MTRLNDRFMFEARVGLRIEVNFFYKIKGTEQKNPSILSFCYEVVDSEGPTNFYKGLEISKFFKHHILDLIVSHQTTQVIYTKIKLRLVEKGK